MSFRRVGMAALVAVGALALIFCLAKPSPPSRMLPTPNGYDDFVRAGMMIQQETPDVRQMSIEALRDYVRTNGPALTWLREGLEKHCKVTTDYAPNYMARHVLECMAVKRCAWVLSAEGKLAEKENRFEDAAAVYLDLIQYGYASGTGGVWIDKLISRACETMGIRSLTNILSQLPKKDICLMGVHKLQELNSRRETLDEMMKNEHEWSRRNTPLKERIGDMFKGEWKASATGFKKDMQTLERESRTLMLDFAVRAFELGEGRKPKSVMELVPSYLREIPKDPTTGTNISASY